LDKFSVLPLRLSLSLFFPNYERHRRGFGGEEGRPGGSTAEKRFWGLGVRGGGGAQARAGRGTSMARARHGRRGRGRRWLPRAPYGRGAPVKP